MSDPSSATNGDWDSEDDADPYDKVVFIQGHRHAEPVCAWPDCQTYLTREQMAGLPEEPTP